MKYAIYRHDDKRNEVPFSEPIATKEEAKATLAMAQAKDPKTKFFIRKVPEKTP